MIHPVLWNQGGFPETAPSPKSRPTGAFRELFQTEQAKGTPPRQSFATGSNPIAETPTAQVKTLTGPEILGDTSDRDTSLWDTSLWEDLARDYDIHHATFAELCDISSRLYHAGQISLADHAYLSFDPTRIPHPANAKFYFTPADPFGKRDWIAEYQARAEFELKNGSPSNYQYIINHYLKGILSRLERK